jgi:Superinfection immunity protein
MFLIHVALFFMAYMFPWCLAVSRHHRNSGAIAVVNFFLGWTVIGWILALVWASTDNVKREQTVRAA